MFATDGTIEADILVRTGRTFTLAIACQEVDPTGDTDLITVRDLTGWTGSMQIRSNAEDATVLATATVAIDVDTGIVTATITDEDTAVMTWRSGVYDLIITDGADIDTLAEGAARLRRSVTRSS